MTTRPKRVYRYHSADAILATLGAVVLASLAGCAQTPSRRPPEPDSPMSATAFRPRPAAPLLTRSGVIGVGDELEMQIVSDFTEPASPIRIRVGDDNAIMVPVIGKVKVAGLMLEGAERVVHDALVAGDVYRSPVVSIKMEKKRTNRVWVKGAVKKANQYELPVDACTLFAALGAAENLDDDARPLGEIRRLVPAPDGSGGKVPQTIPFDLRTARGEGGADHPLQDGDEVVVFRSKPIFVDGLVKKAGEIMLPWDQEVRVLQAIAMAGGSSNFLATKAFVIREIPGKTKPERYPVNLSEAKKNPNGQDNMKLVPGDLVVVENTTSTFLFDTAKTVIRIGGSIPLLSL